jgi:hypothetical protein
MNQEGDGLMQRVDSDILSLVPEEPPFKEIELMKELVLEFGEAINDRIKEASSPDKKREG